MALSPSLVDIFLGSLSQVQSPRSGPVGRLLTAKNVIARQFDPGAQPQRIALKQRNGFTSYSTDLRLASDGSAVDSAGKWSNPELISSLDEQLMSICNAVPRVWNGSSWSYYQDTRAVTNKFTQDILHTSNHTIQVPDHQYLNGVRCNVWTETTISNALPVTGVYVSIRAADGAWLRTPQLIYADPTVNAQTLAKVVADPDNNVFWVFLNKVGVGGQKVAIHIYDLHGQQLATTEIDRNDVSTPGFWDPTFLPAGNVHYFVSPNSVQYGGVGTGGPGTWLIPAGAFLPSAVDGTFTISGDPAGGVDGTYTITAVASPGVVTATPSATPTLSFTIPGASATSFGGGTWNFPSISSLPIGATVVITGSAVPALDGTYTVLTWNSGAHIATMSPSPSSGGTVGSGGSVIVTYAASLPYTLDPGDVIEAQFEAPARIVLIQPTDPVTPTPGVDFSVLVFDGISTITETRYSDLSVACVGPVSWVTNDLGDNLGYFATLAGGEGYEVRGWQTTGAGQTHEYDSGQFIDPTNAKYLDSFIGWTELGVNVHRPSFNVGIAQLTNGSTSDAGPLFDPAYRQINVFNIDFDNNPTYLKSLNSVVPVSRAFKHDDEYYAFTYYQSGSGLTVTPDSQTVTITDFSDYMTGAQVQPLQVQTGDDTHGAPITAGQNSVFVNTVFKSASHGSVSIGSPDTVAVVAVTGFGALGIPDGTNMLRWRFAGLSAAAYAQSRLVVSTSNIPEANATWDIVGVSGNDFITPLYNTNLSGGVPSGTFSTGFIIVSSMTGYVTTNLSGVITPSFAHFFQPGGTVTVTGSSHGNNITAQSIERLYVGVGPSYLGTGASSDWSAVWVTTGSQSTAGDTFAAVLTPTTPYNWNFASGDFDASYVNSTSLVIEDADGSSHTPGPDVSTFPITGTSGGGNLVTAGAVATVPYIWSAPPFPSVSIQLPLSVRPYTFSFADITVDYTYQDAMIIVEGSPIASNNTVYQVQAVDPDNNLLYAAPADGSDNGRNQDFASGTETVTIIRSNSIVAPWQATWFMTPLTGTQAQVGRFDNGIAYAEWRLEGDSVLGPNEFPLALASVCQTDDGIEINLPYRAQNVTSNLPVATVRGQINLAGASVTANTVGLKTWRLLTKSGTPALASGELLLPGPMAGEFTLSGFTEDGINLGFEQPYLRSQGTVSSGQLGLTPNATYQYVVVGEYTDENGNRIYTPPSPALIVHLASGKNSITLQGRAMNAIASSGVLIDGEYGTTNRLVGISIYRTAITGTGANEQVVATHYKITNDLAVNGLAPVSSLNASGFSFPDDFTWQYVDQNPDVVVLGAEQLYTDKGYLPRYPAPAFFYAIGSWKNRSWVLASDGSIWMSGEKTEGDAVWFNGALRIVLPTDDRPVSMAVMEDNLIVFCEGGSVWQIPATTFPDGTGRNGTLPTPIQLPFSVVCTGHAVSLRSAVAFSSDARGSGLWAITRDLKLVPLSQPIQDALASATISGLTVDADQRLHVCTGSDAWFVYDQVIDCWFQFEFPVSALLPTTTNGLAAFQATDRVYFYDTTSFVDFDGTTHTPIAPDVTLADVNFGTVRGLKSVWEMQLVGTYKGPHRLNIALSYPDEYEEPTTTFDPFTPGPDAPYIVPFNPRVEEAAAYGIRFYADFVGVDSPGDSFEVELITAEVGIDRKTGATKLPDSQTAVADE